jgi:hypothetical protein
MRHRFLVSSRTGQARKIGHHPGLRSSLQEARPFRGQARCAAEDLWENTVRDFDDELGGNDLREAERRARRQLTRVAYVSLRRLGWT